MTGLPERGWSDDHIERQLRCFEDANPDRRRTALSFGVHFVSDQIQDVMRRAHHRFAHNDDRFAFVRPGSHEIERQVRSIAAQLLGDGVASVVTDITATDTESTFNALHAARQWARATKPHVARPEVVAPRSANASLDQIAAYLDLTVLRAPQRSDLRSDPDAIAGMIGPNTIALVGSAPDPVFGYFDDIAQLGELATRHDLWLHVDASIGGFLAPFAAAIGEPIPPWDFSVPGVRSMTAGLDKWGYAMKSASIVAWRDADTRRLGLIMVEGWPLGALTFAGIGGTRSGGAVAAAWAVLHHLGREGYELHASHLVDGKREYARRLAAVPGVQVVEPGLSIINFTHATVPVHAIVGAMLDRGWHHFACAQPSMVSLVLDAASIDVIDDYVADLESVVTAADPWRSVEPDGVRALVGLTGTGARPDRVLQRGAGVRIPPLRAIGGRRSR